MSNKRPNVVLIVSEDHGPHLGCYGDANARTPTLDRLAREGVRFDHHQTPCAICSPGRASILTGLYPHQNGQIDLTTHGYAMYRPFSSLPSRLKQAGYRTARLGKLHVLPEEAFDFDFVWNDPGKISFRHRDIRATAETAGRFAAQATAADQPYLLYICPSDTHLPLLHQSFGEPARPRSGESISLPDYCPIDAPHMRDRLAAYYNCLERLDRCVGLILASLKKQSDRETIVIFTTDHGLQFIRGKTTCYENGLRVSMILHAPGRIDSGRVCDALTSHVDLLPTVLDLLDLPLPSDRPGASLLPLARGESVPWREFLVGEWTGAPCLWFPQRSIRNGRYKLIVNYLRDRGNPCVRAYCPPGRWETSLNDDDWNAAPADLRAALEFSLRPPAEELYDLRHDPYETRNLAGRPDAVGIQDILRAALLDWQRRYEDRIADPEVLAELTRMHEEMLGKHYPQGYGIPANRSAMQWTYGRWIDPGVPV